MGLLECVIGLGSVGKKTVLEIFVAEASRCVFTPAHTADSEISLHRNEIPRKQHFYTVSSV